MRPQYEHTQIGWTLLLAVGLGAVLLLAFGMQMPHNGASLLIAGALLPLVALVFGRLTVRIDRAQLTVAFGYGWPRRRVALADIASSEITRTTWFEGWGIRLTRRGWLWNVSGLDAVLLQLAGGKRLLIGTDEPRRLHAAIERVRTQAPSEDRR